MTIVPDTASKHGLSSRDSMPPRTHLCSSAEEAEKLKRSLQQLWSDRTWHIYPTYRIHDEDLPANAFLVSPQSSEWEAIENLYIVWKNISDEVHALPAKEKPGIPKIGWWSLVGGVPLGFVILFANIAGSLEKHGRVDWHEACPFLLAVPGCVVGILFVLFLVDSERQSS